MTLKVRFTYLRIVRSMKELNTDVRLHFVRDVIAKEQVKVEKISTDINPADMLTKPIPVAKFEQALSLLNVLPT